MNSCRAWSLAIAAVSMTFGATAASADEYWQVQTDGLTVVASGKKAAAAQTATMTVQLQRAVRWMVGWPADYRPPAALVLALPNSTIERYFGDAASAADEEVGLYEAKGLTMAAPQLTIVVSSLSPQRGHEFDRMKLLYGRTLLDKGSSGPWPDCIRRGMSIVVASSIFRGERELLVQPGRVGFISYGPTATHEPSGFVRPIDGAELFDREQGYRERGCYLLSLLSLRDEPLPRAGFSQYFNALGAGSEFDQAAQAAFGITDRELGTRITEFVRGFGFQPKSYEMRIDLAGDVPVWPEPEPVTGERMHNILSQLSAKLTPAAAAP